ncbi:hypothetical protein BH24CHL7_BH24CHL7_04310 [soil metagenome]
MIEAGEFHAIDDERRPYAPAANVISVLERVRRVNLPDAVDADLLRNASVSEGAMGRVLFALRFLRLVESNGRPSDQLRAIARAADEEWRELLAGVVREAYAGDFARLDLARDTQPQIVSAFRRYEPRSQTERMVMLFLGLCRSAGIPVLDAPRERQMQPRATHTAPPARTRPERQRPARRSGRETSQDDGSVSPGGLLFGVTVDDIAALPEGEFDDVWRALGKIARARAAKVLKQVPETERGAESDTAEEDSEGQ